MVQTWLRRTSQFAVLMACVLLPLAGATMLGAMVVVVTRAMR